MKPYKLTEFQRPSRQHRGVPPGVHASRSESEMRQVSPLFSLVFELSQDL